MNPNWKMHIVSLSDEELFLLLHGHFLCSSSLILLLQLHIPVLILSVRQRMVQTLSVVPCLLCVLLTAAGTLSPWGMGQLEVIIFTVLI